MIPSPTETRGSLILRLSDTAESPHGMNLRRFAGRWCTVTEGVVYSCARNVSL